MCGRFAQTSLIDYLRVFDVVETIDLGEPRYNVAPTQDILTVVRENDARKIRFLRWGLIPSWADDPSIGSRMINARGEGVAEKPSFRSAFRHRRCVIPADGFYEWQKAEKGKIPFFIRRPDGDPLALAGLWETWGKGPAPIHTVTIITTEASPEMAPIHDRMPAILPIDEVSDWLDPDTSPAHLQSLIHPFEEELEFRPVSRLVNSPSNEGPDLIAPAT